VSDGPIVVDFETEEIDDRPHYPPKPVGVGLWLPQQAPEYYRWGHPTGNNCTAAHARRLVQEVWKAPQPKLFHSGEFDMEVAQVHMGLPLLPLGQWHDSLLTAYLRNPHDANYQLKSSAERRLGWPPTERDKLEDWIVTNVPEARRAKTQWGAYISRAPGELVAEYTKGDLTRTRALFEHDYPYIRDMGMGAAYERERRIIPILLANSQQGVRVDVGALERDVPRYQTQLESCDTAIRRYLGVRDLNIDSNEDLANAIEARGLVKPNQWLQTPGGKRSVSKESLEVSLRDPKLRAALGYRQALSTCLHTFMEHWLAVARQTGGYVQIHWNSTRQDQKKRGGTRTGRLSSSPNFQNIFTTENLLKLYVAAQRYWRGWLPLPAVRGYIVADSKDHVILDRDFNQQELRILAHYEGGDMQTAYRNAPNLDLHAFAAELIRQSTGVIFDTDPKIARRITKETAFGLIYGMGIPALAEKLERSLEEAKIVKNAYLGTFPGVDELMEDLKYRGRHKEPVRTWGGRVYFAEEARAIDGYWRDFSYKLINYLIQGSAADCTKEAIIRYDSIKKEGRFLITVHDENLVGAPKKCWRQEMQLMKQAMESVEFDVPMTSTGEWGYRWLNMTKEAA
jgi:DNA polymerase I-like protein with 3'-5' exonuclease and polymerase domains